MFDTVRGMDRSALDLNYYIQDMTSVGLPRSFASIFGNIFTDSQVQKYNPERYHFYVQLMQAMMNPNSRDVAKMVIGLSASNRMKREETRERLQRIMNAFEYIYASGNNNDERNDMLKKLSARLSANPITSKFKINYPRNMKGGAQVDIRQILEQLKKTDNSDIIDAIMAYKDEQLEAALNTKSFKDILKKPDDGSSVPLISKTKLQELLSYLREVTKPSVYTELNAALDKAEANESTEEQRTVVTRYLNDPVVSPENMKIKANDRIIFIAGTFVLRSIALFTVQWGINAYLVRDFKRAFLLYVGTYICLFLLWVILANSQREIKFFRLLFFYLCIEPHGLGRIVVHVLIQLLLIPVPFVVRDPTSTVNTDRESATPLTVEERQDIMRTIGNFTFIIWILTSFIAVSY